MKLYFGVDWSHKHHDLAVVNVAGATLAQLRFGHKELHQLETLQQQFDSQAQECLVALETAHNLIIDYLWAHAYQQVYVVPPNVVKSSRGRYCQTGTHTDLTDANLLANRWLAVLWKLWQSGLPSDEAFHRQQRALRPRPL